MHLQRVKHVDNAHSTFITGLECVPCHTETGLAITGQSEAAVISISVDNLVFDLTYLLLLFEMLTGVVDRRSAFTEFLTGGGCYLSGWRLFLLLVLLSSRLFCAVILASRCEVCYHYRL